jgi:TetR/AcrR family transcriptional repressor of nem operon
VGVGEICRKAKVNKGSFYHFFPSKEALAVAALEAYWQCIQPQLDQVFSPQKDPLKRIKDYCDNILRMQRQKKEECGSVCGCPYTSVGIEQCCQSKPIAKAIEKLMERTMKYFIAAVKDAAEEGLIETRSPVKTAGMVHTYILGALTQARIHNDLRRLDGVKDDLMEILGATSKV